MSRPPVKLRRHAALPSRAAMQAGGDWLVIMPEAARRQAAARLPCAELLYAHRQRMGCGATDSEPLSIDLPDSPGTRIAFASIAQGLPAFELLTLARKLTAVAVAHRASAIHVVAAGFPARECTRITEALAAAVFAAAAEMPSYKKQEVAVPRIVALDVYGMRSAGPLRRSRAEAEGNALARHLSMLPANLLTPAEYRKRIRGIARTQGWQMQFFDERALARRKAGAFLAVAQGSATRDAGIVRLRYRPGRTAARSRARIALVGKGVCFDTGGVNLKTARYMYNMHQDMQGSAVALGTLLALSETGFRHPVDCWLPLVMNQIGPRAYKPNDVITASDGTTIEIVDTDAEGRMILADTLALASRESPGLIVDFATLTGACVYSLGHAYSGIFTNRADLLPALVETGRRSGERVWPFPMDADYDEALRSEIADVKQCSTESGMDHILAARFLQRFVAGQVPWVHVDLSASRSKGGLAHIPTETTGFGVRFAMSLLLDTKLPQ